MQILYIFFAEWVMKLMSNAKFSKTYVGFLCLGEFLRSLPPLAKKYVLQMLYIDSPITAKSIEVWVLPDGYSKHRVAIDRLIQLRVFTETVDRYAPSFSLHNISFENGRIC